MSQSFLNLPHRREKDWVYVSLTVVDGDRRLNPTHVAFDRLLFDEAPRLRSAQVEIIVVNGEVEDRRVARVLPHDEDATRIPIRLLPATGDGSNRPALP